MWTSASCHRPFPVARAEHAIEVALLQRDVRRLELVEERRAHFPDALRGARGEAGAVHALVDREARAAATSTSS